MRVRHVSCMVWVCPGLACGQSAVMRVSHNDLDGIVEPGQTVHVTATLSWQNASVLWDIRGGVRAANDVGVASNPVFPYVVENLPNRVIAPGTPVGGSVTDIWIFNGDSGFLAGWWPATPPWTSSVGVVVTRFAWTAPAMLGEVTFNWEQDAVQPKPLIFPNFSPVPWYVAVPMTSMGTSLTVVPGVGSGVVLVAGLAMGRRRR